jgi:hypothetical protein
MFAVISCRQGFDIRSSATGKNRGHLHSVNRHGPVSVWMNSEWRHEVQGLAKLASRSILRIAEGMGSFMGYSL